MGFDVSYHPISEEEIKQWYFDRLEDVRNQNLEAIYQLVKKSDIDDFYIDKYLQTLNAGLTANENDSFEKTHGFYVAVTQGFFRKFFYTRGSALSFLIEENVSIAKYTKSWEEILETAINKTVENKIIENYSSGVYIPHERLKELYIDYNKNPKFRETLNNHFSNGRIKVFMRAVMFSIDNKLGLLEATEVILPNTVDLIKSQTFSNLFNCERDGLLLYEKAAQEQIKEVEKNVNESKETNKSESKTKEGILGKILNIFKK